MTFLIRIAGVLSGLLVAASLLFPAQAQRQPLLPSQTHLSVRSETSIPTHLLPPVDTEALRNENERDNRIGPYQYGTVLETSLTPEHYGMWEKLPSGDWLWRLRLRSEGSVSLSLGFRRFQLPEGATLYVHGPDNTDIRGPYTAADATGGQHWTPLVRGDEIIIEVEVPRNQRSALDLEIGHVVHGYRSLTPSSDQNPRAKSGACNLDVACEEADPWRKQVRSVGRITFELDGAAFLCTGALVNNTGEDTTPYFLTAEHCVPSPDVATTMVFYWNYQNPTCRTPGTFENGQVTSDSPDDQTSSGAVLRARYGSTHEDGNIAGKPDLALVEVDDEIPNTYNLYFSGWSRKGDITAKGVTIHHPSGDGKRISFDRDSTSLISYPSTSTCEAPQGNTHLEVGDWEVGTTEGGSSGAPLFNSDHHIVGVLSGGCAGCGNDGDAEDNNLPDWYGRIALGFENGDYKDKTLADVLDPKNTGAMTLDGRPQCEPNDQTPPATIEDLRVDSIGVTSMTLQWTAPGEDGNKGTASAYELRYSTSPISSAADFRSATAVQNPPSPSSAGTIEHAKVEGLTPDSTYYFAIRARDCSGNTPPIGTTPSGTFLPDKVPPAVVSDVELADINTSVPSVTLRWTTTGDDGRLGAASEYLLWFDTTPIRSAVDTQSAQKVTASTSVPAGQKQTATLEDRGQLQRGRTYYFAVVAEDNAGNQSPLAPADHKAVLVKDIQVEKGGATASPISEIKFVLNESQNVRVALYDLLGRRIRVLLDERVREGFERTVRFDTGTLSSGPYFLRFVGDTFTTTRKIVVVQ